MSIPKIIHQTYISRESVPQHWKQSIEEWTRLHPEAHYMFWSDEDNRKFVEEKFPDFLEKYDSFPYNIQRADAIRYMILYHYGGIYSDLDLIPNIEVFSHLENGDIFLTKSANIKSIFTNMFMGSRPKQKFWLEVIEEMKKDPPFYCFGKHLIVMNTTGPLMLNRVIENTSEKITILSPKLFNPSNITSVSNKSSEDVRNTVLRVVEGSSWHSWDSKLYNFVYNYAEIFIGMLVMLIAVVIVFCVKWIYLYFWTMKNCEVVCSKS